MKNGVVMEFHVSRKARDLYQFDDLLFSLSGNVLFPNFHASRVFSQKINDKRDLVRFPEQAVRAGQLNAMGLIDEILHYVVGLYRDEKNLKLMEQALDWLNERLGRSAVDRVLRRFADEFPAVSVYRHQIELDDYIEAETAGVPNRLIVLEEMLMLWLANMNPAFSPFLELFDDSGLERETLYPQVMAALHDFLDTQPFFGPDHQNLIDLLRSPAVAVPHSLAGQLEYIRQRWGSLLGKFFYRLLSSLDLIKEEQIADERRMAFWGRAPAEVYEFAGLEAEPERFSHDLDWMPRLVLMAKNAYVWLDQLSRKYRRPIHRLDQVPDEDLDLLARWGFTGLWLIGLWERSQASRKIKQQLGNPEAVASAYSLYDYEIAADLGGEQSYQNLKDRAWSRGIRLASDMVPNHVGIDSRWVIEHPDWFISSDYSPFPAYRFTGPDFSWHGDVGIYIEDHYFDRTDAAVVFKRVDRRNGEERYIYHGNDGTRMPWNDTAQLNYMKEEVREAVIQTILHVARKFSVIRFDAAMTLTKKHYQRLWFPEPGTGGAIPSRAEQGMTKEEFHRRMPEEFWRQVVDRVAREAPDTLLLAEAFWLLEGYFVRTLGMHRVYNSAFMNMLKDEENAKYRSVMKNTLEFNPEVLKRFVNFMSNPDEETALFQFGKGDKYFGVCTVMVTMPGLPMFGHGQIEGFSEKYGMEYRYARWEERPDRDLIERHEREIFPLMKRRHLFADVKHFLLYDFYTPEGHVNENVFAYSNRCGDERALVIYHNRYDSARGWVRTSAAYSAKGEEGEGSKLVQKDLGESLGLHSDQDFFCLFRDHAAGLEYIRSSHELCEKGLYVELGAYKYQVLIDFREVRDTEMHQYAELAAYLNGRGVPSIEEALKEIFLQPLQQAFEQWVNSEFFGRLIEARLREPDGQIEKGLLGEAGQKMVNLLLEVKRISGGGEDEEAIVREVQRKLEEVLRLPVRPVLLPWSDTSPAWGTLLSWLFVHAIGKVAGPTGFAEQSLSWIEEWRLGKTIAGVLKDLGLEEAEAWRSVTLVKLLTHHQRWFSLETYGPKPAYHVIESLLKDSEVQEFLQVNRYNDVLWFNKEALDELLWWLFWIAVVDIGSDPEHTADQKAKKIEAIQGIILSIKEAETRSGYQIEKLLEAVKGQ